MPIKLPGIYVEVRGNYTQLEKDVKAAKQIVSKQARGMSAALNNAIDPRTISKNTNQLISTFGTLDRSATDVGKTFDQIGVDLGELRKITGLSEKDFAKYQSRLLKTTASKKQENALKSLARSLNLNEKEVKKLGKQYGLTRKQIASVNATLSRQKAHIRGGNALIGSATRAVAGLAATYASLHSVVGALKIADDYTLADAKIKLGTESQEEFNSVYKQLYDISKETGGQLVSNAASFSKLSLNSDFSSASLVRSQEILNKAMVIQGANTQENASFMMQYAQAMGSGVVNGNEFTAMSEANSYILGKIADHLGTTIVGLKKMGAEGKLTSEMFFEALLAVGEEVDTTFTEMPVTLSRAGNKLKEVFKALIADTNRAGNTTGNIAKEVDNLGNIIEANQETIISTFAGLVEMASKAAHGVMAVTRSVRGLSIVAASEDKSLLDWIFADGQDMQNWQNEIANGTAFLKDQLSVVRAEIADVNDRWGLSSDSTTQLKGLRDKEKAILAQIESIKEKVKIADLDAVIAEEFSAIDNFVAPSGKGESVFDEVSKEAVKAIDNFNDAYLKATLSQTDYELTILSKQYDEYAKHVTDKTKLDAWYDTEKQKILNEQVELEKRETDKLLKDLESKAKDKADAYRDVVGDLEEIRPQLAFDLRFDALEEQAEAYLKTGLAPDLVAQWRTKTVKLLKEDEILSSDDFFAGFQVGLQNSIDDMNTWAETAAGVADEAFGGMSDALTGFVMDGKLDFDDLAKSIIEDMVRIAIQQQVIAPIMGGLFGNGGVASGIGSFFGFHTGGLAGVDAPTFVRSLPKYHTGGIAGDEVPAILKRGEGVFTEGQMKAIGSGLGGGSTTNVYVTNNANGNVSTSEQENDQGGKDIFLVIDQATARHINTPGSATQKALLAQTGAQRQLVAR